MIHSEAVLSICELTLAEISNCDNPMEVRVTAGVETPFDGKLDVCISSLTEAATGSVTKFFEYFGTRVVGDGCHEVSRIALEFGFVLVADVNRCKMLAEGRSVADNIVHTLVVLFLGFQIAPRTLLVHLASQ